MHRWISNSFTVGISWVKLVHFDRVYLGLNNIIMRTLMKITSVIRLSSLNIVFIIIIIIIEQASTFSSEAFRMMLWLSTLVLHLCS